MSIEFRRVYINHSTKQAIIVTADKSRVYRTTQELPYLDQLTRIGIAALSYAHLGMATGKTRCSTIISHPCNDSAASISTPTKPQSSLSSSLREGVSWKAAQCHQPALLQATSDCSLTIGRDKKTKRASDMMTPIMRPKKTDIVRKRTGCQRCRSKKRQVGPPTVRVLST